MNQIWIFYLLGFSLALIYKYLRYVYVGRASGKSIRTSTLEWFFDPSAANCVSWVGTIGGVWLVGSIYINRIVDLAPLTGLPLDKSIAFFLGAIFEYLVPNLLKWITAKIPG